MTNATLVVCTESSDRNWRWLEPSFVGDGLKFLLAYAAPKNSLERNAYFNLARFRGSWEAVQLARKSNAKVIVTHGPTLAAWCALAARLVGLKTTILAHSFNFTNLPSPLKRHIFSFALSSVDSFVVYSTMERDLYAKVFGLPADRFEVVHWGVRPPAVDLNAPPVEQGDYVSAIGGNARDYRTLIEAARQLPDIRFVLVVRPESLRGLDVPSNVKVHVNVPFEKAMDILARSRFMALPLLHSEVPCGHVTLVAAMHLRKAFVITDSTGVHDYAHDGENALMVPAGSVDRFAGAIRRLWDDPSLCLRLGENGQRFAARECSEERIVEHLRKWLQSHGMLPAA